MKINLLLILLAVGLMAGAAQANLLKNPSFEEGVFKPNGTPDYWVHYYTSSPANHSWLSSPAEAHWGSKYIKMNLWSAGTTAWLLQTVNVTQGQEYAFSVWAKCPIISETSEAWGYYEWLNSASTVIGYGWLPVGYVGSNWTHVEFGTLTAPESATQAIYWLAEPPENNFRGILFDDACMNTPLPSLPSPPWEGLVAIGNVDLSWTNLAPIAPATSVYVDVLWGTEPNETDPVYNMEPLTLDPVSGQNVTSATIEGLTLGTYYWRVDSYMYGDPNEVGYDINGTDPNLHPVIKGYAWSFDVVSDAPPSSVDAGVDMITWSGEPVNLDATIVDDDQSALTIAWSSDNPAGTEVLFSATDIEDPTVTINKIPHTAAGIVNPSFENFLTGWDQVGTWCGIWNGKWMGRVYITPTDGYLVAYVNGDYGDPDEGAWLSQTLAETLTVDITYTLAVDVVNDGYYNEDVEYKVQLLAGEAVIAEDDNSLPLDTEGDWETSTVVYTCVGESDPNFAYVGQPLEIRLVAKVGTGEMVFDNVHLTADPEFPAPTGVSTIKLTLKASDEENNLIPVKGSMTIDVYDNPCQAARVGLGWAENYPADIAGEYCITDIPDLVEFVESWLNSTELTAPQPKPSQPGGIGNAGFEDPPQGPGQYNNTCFNPPSAYHWTKVGNSAGVWDPGPGWPGYGDETPEGENCAYVGEGSGITQVLTETLKAETNYILSVQVGNNDYYTGGTYKVELLAGGMPLVSHSENIEDIEDDTFALRTLEYEYDSEQAALLGQPLEIKITLSNPGGAAEADFDDVRLEIECTNPNLPSDNAGDSWIAWSGQEVQLDPTVVNNDATVPQRTLSYLWSADDDTGVVFSPSATVEAPAVTITKATTNPSAVKLTLAVTLEGEGTVVDSMAIDVYDDACKAATGAGYEYAVTDFNGNCITGLGDFAILAKAWLVDYDTLTESVPKP